VLRVHVRQEHGRVWSFTLRDAGCRQDECLAAEATELVEREEHVRHVVEHPGAEDHVEGADARWKSWVIHIGLDELHTVGVAGVPLLNSRVAGLMSMPVTLDAPCSSAWKA
jgi:hypothetical protein